MRPRKKRSIIESISTITAIYDSINHPYDIFTIKKMKPEEESIYQQEKIKVSFKRYL